MAARAASRRKRRLERVVVEGEKKERDTGVEPVLPAWEAGAQPIGQSRKNSAILRTPFPGKQEGIRKTSVEEQPSQVAGSGTARAAGWRTARYSDAAALPRPCRFLLKTLHYPENRRGRRAYELSNSIRNGAA